jgi:hypothetical protein
VVGDSLEGVSALAVQADRKILAAGFAPVKGGGSFQFSFALARYLPDGRLDRDFGKAGIVLTQVGA